MLVSHNMEQVKEICSRAVWLEKGTVQMDGECQEVVQAYVQRGDR